MRKNKNTSKIVLALLVAVLATTISYSAFSNMQNQVVEQQKLINLMQKTKGAAPKETFAYAVSTKDLKAGELVADEDVDFKQFDAKNPSAFDNRSDVINKVLLQDIKSGESFTTAHIAKVSNDNVSLKPGFRALTMPAENFQGKSDSMIAGSNVDVYSASKDNDWKLENVRIISLEGGSKPLGATSSGPSMSGATGITFEVASDDIADFISSASKSKLVLVARNPNDKVVSRKSARKKTSAIRGGSSGSSYSAASLPNLPAEVPIGNYKGSSLGISGLPQPIKPTAPSSSVEVIEANVKSKVNFE